MNDAKGLIPLIVTNKLAETRKYYVEQAGFTATMEQEGYLQVRHGDESGPELSFVVPDMGPPDMLSPAFGGAGLILSVRTGDADAKHRELKQAGVKPSSQPSDRPWGWRSFTAVDPNGIVLDFFSLPNEASGADAQS
jgi:uncharacterized glyoxalase superfamily protein PhnB